MGLIFRSALPEELEWKNWVKPAERYESCHIKNREISSGPGIEISTVNSSNLNANSEHLHGVASMNFWN